MAQLHILQQVAPELLLTLCPRREREDSVAHMRQLGAGCKLRENVHTIDTEAASTAALLLHPFRPLVTSVDGAGVVRVHNYRHSTSVHRFHVTGVEASGTCASC